LDQALQALPAGYRPDPKDPDAAQVSIRSDSAGATDGFAAAWRAAGVGFLPGRSDRRFDTPAAEVY
jgi:hypothetical protein